MKVIFFGYNKAVEEIVSDIRKGLQREGMDDLADYVKTEESDFKKVTAKRNPKFQDTKIFLPRVLCKTKTGSWRKIMYANDILQEIDLSKISYSKKRQLDSGKYRFPKSQFNKNRYRGQSRSVQPAACKPKQGRKNYRYRLLILS